MLTWPDGRPGIALSLSTCRYLKSVSERDHVFLCVPNTRFNVSYVFVPFHDKLFTLFYCLFT